MGDIEYLTVTEGEGGGSPGVLYGRIDSEEENVILSGGTFVA
jgi:hypothetical protein